MVNVFYFFGGLLLNMNDWNRYCRNNVSTVKSTLSSDICFMSAVDLYICCDETVIDDDMRQLLMMPSTGITFISNDVLPLVFSDSVMNSTYTVPHFQLALGPHFHLQIDSITFTNSLTDDGIPLIRLLVGPGKQD